MVPRTVLYLSSLKCRCNSFECHPSAFCEVKVGMWLGLVASHLVWIQIRGGRDDFGLLDVPGCSQRLLPFQAVELA